MLASAARVATRPHGVRSSIKVVGATNDFTKIGSPGLGGTRTMAENPQKVLQRIVSTQNIEKITKSFKMVSAAKMAMAQKKLAEGKPFGTSLLSLFPDKIMLDEVLEGDGAANVPKAGTFLVVSSDRGLCGAVNTYTVKMVKKLLGEDKDATVACCGDKGRTSIQRFAPNVITSSYNEMYRTPPTFSKASIIAGEVLRTNPTSVTLCHAAFKSAIAYDTLLQPIPAIGDGIDGPSEDATPEKLAAYDFEPEFKQESMQNLYEFSLATSLYGAMIENRTAEESARMNAMENASKNAGEMVEKLTVIYNRSRQAKITTELIEIISGAEALESSK